ncbi:hypothetical protein Y032_0052g2181 [Ancylostoma ceylanicum]|uniref:MSP domain-containing protein n=1 Tax=Ancylostoma ceylanicum TaxID=53326 RepID=A0A016U897_9BILA|nr:hypothetical protein Y032_0052g2181 [Ancylostoma ceylanicum]
MSLNVEPAVGNFPATGGNATHNIISLVDTKLAFKVKSSNNDHYRVRPVYGFVEGKVGDCVGSQSIIRFRRRSPHG